MRAGSRRKSESEPAPATSFVDRHRAQSRQGGITSGGRAVLVALGYSEVVISLRKLRYRIGRLGLSQGLLRAPQKPHKSATRWAVPQESHGRNGTLRYTCDAC
jgi:hypothetical protein